MSPLMNLQGGQQAMVHGMLGRAAAAGTRKLDAGLQQRQPGTPMIQPSSSAQTPQHVAANQQTMGENKQAHADLKCGELDTLRRLCREAQGSSLSSTTT